MSDMFVNMSQMFVAISAIYNVRGVPMLKQVFLRRNCTSFSRSFFFDCMRAITRDSTNHQSSKKDFEFLTGPRSDRFLLPFQILYRVASYYLFSLTLARRKERGNSRQT